MSNPFTFFARMSRDKGGNMLMMAAAALIALTGMIGGAFVVAP